MKPLSEIKYQLDFYPQEVSSSIRYFKKAKIDWNVFLKTKGKNLQRDFCWTLQQKREIINSVLIGRHIPHCAIIDTIDPTNKVESIYEIIDGKQRLSSIIDFTYDKFTIIIEGKEYLFSELPNEYQNHIDKFNFRYYRVDEQYDKPITDEQRLSWFKFLNFAGTPQDEIHLASLD
jgi:hypothetical protein